jgi:hypothetical protein
MALNNLDNDCSNYTQHLKCDWCLASMHERYRQSTKTMNDTLNIQTHQEVTFQKKKVTCKSQASLLS